MLRSYGTLIGSLLLFILIGAARVLGWLGAPLGEASLTLFGWTFQLPFAVQLGVGMLLMLMDIYLLLRIMSENALYDTRTYFAPSLFLMLICGAPFTLPLTTGQICLTLTLFSILILLTSYQQKRAVSEYVAAFLFFGIATLFAPHWIYLIPFLFIGCSFIGSLTGRTFLAALLGLIAPWWIAAGVLFFLDGIDSFCLPFLELVRFSPIDYTSLPVEHIASMLLVILLLLPALISYPSAAPSLKERTRVAYSLLITLLIGVLLFCFLQPQQIDNLFPLFACLTSLLISRLLLTPFVRSKPIFQEILIFLLIVYLTCPLWMPLLTF